MSRLEARDRVVKHVLSTVNSQVQEAASDIPGPGNGAASAGATATAGGRGFRRQQRMQVSPADHYYIAESSRSPIDITGWLGELQDVRATKDFLDRLKDHLLERILGVDYSGDQPIFSEDERDSLVISQNLMYEHSTLRVNYTTYDLRREQDTINPRTRADIMVLSRETDGLRHPYWYARVIRIFHVNVRYYGDNSNEPSRDLQRMNVLFVRWFGRDTAHSAGFSARRLYRVGFLTEDDPDAFGFLDPDLVIRGVHLIPAFSGGRTPTTWVPSFVRPEEDQDEDWFVDRDMFMRFRGGGVGHTISRQWNTFLQADCQELRENDETFEIATRGDDVEEGENDDDDTSDQERSDSDNTSEGQDDSADEDERTKRGSWTQTTTCTPKRDIIDHLFQSFSVIDRPPSSSNSRSKHDSDSEHDVCVHAARWIPRAFDMYCNLDEVIKICLLLEDEASDSDDDNAEDEKAKAARRRVLQKRSRGDIKKTATCFEYLKEIRTIPVTRAAARRARLASSPDPPAQAIVGSPLCHTPSSPAAPLTPLPPSSPLGQPRRSPPPHSPPPRNVPKGKREQMEDVPDHWDTGSPLSEAPNGDTENDIQHHSQSVKNLRRPQGDFQR
ncbi:hypothetical protein BU15DRAFT_83296 [Melanogaster broomeanus]|nr:hypothetical protein BU15DRAFT_83296 [Melanogaster broomeanus]